VPFAVSGNFISDYCAESFWWWSFASSEICSFSDIVSNFLSEYLVTIWLIFWCYISVCICCSAGDIRWEKAVSVIFFWHFILHIISIVICKLSAYRFTSIFDVADCSHKKTPDAVILVATTWHSTVSILVGKNWFPGYSCYFSEVWVCHLQNFCRNIDKDVFCLIFVFMLAVHL